MTRVHYGCGGKIGASWSNFDASPMMRIERIPLFGRIAKALAGGGDSFPSEARFGDITRGPLVTPGSATSVYASHVLEHLALEDVRLALRHTFEMLAPGGVFRLIVPDLRARVEKYRADVAAGDVEAASTFMRVCLLGTETRPRGLRAIRKAFSGSSHLWMFDAISMRSELASAGFTSIRECEFGDATDSAFAELEERNRFIDQWFQLRECAMEARRPHV